MLYLYIEILHKCLLWKNGLNTSQRRCKLAAKYHCRLELPWGRYIDCNIVPKRRVLFCIKRNIESLPFMGKIIQQFWLIICCRVLFAILCLPLPVFIFHDADGWGKVISESQIYNIARGRFRPIFWGWRYNQYTKWFTGWVIFDRRNESGGCAYKTGDQVLSLTTQQVLDWALDASSISMFLSLFS